MHIFNISLNESDANNHIPNDSVSAESKRIVSEEELADGSVLKLLLMRYHDVRTEQNLKALISCLKHNPPVWLPLRIKPPRNPDDTLLREPVILRNSKGKRYLPIFSRKEDSRNNFGNDPFLWKQLPFLDCITYLRRDSSLDGISVNGFTEKIVISRERFYRHFVHEPAPLHDEVFPLDDRGFAYLIEKKDSTGSVRSYQLDFRQQYQQCLRFSADDALPLTLILSLLYGNGNLAQLLQSYIKDYLRQNESGDSESNPVIYSFLIAHALGELLKTAHIPAECIDLK